MAVRELTCISCPLGCPLQVEIDEAGQVVRVTGNTCKRGEVYGTKEVIGRILLRLSEAC